MNTATDSSPADRQARAARQQAVVAALQAVLPAHAILYTPEDTTPYECDGLTAYRERPLVVACPRPMSRCRRC
jgi:glycolate oxidase